jgi:hypothetical protein
MTTITIIILSIILSIIISIINSISYHNFINKFNLNPKYFPTKSNYTYLHIHNNTFYLYNPHNNSTLSFNSLQSLLTYINNNYIKHTYITPTHHSFNKLIQLTKTINTNTNINTIHTHQLNSSITNFKSTSTKSFHPYPKTITLYLNQPTIHTNFTSFLIK